jgi:hypothetical protein
LTEARPAIVSLPSADAAVVSLDSVGPAQVKTVESKQETRATKTRAALPKLTAKRPRHGNVHSKSGAGRPQRLTLDDF